MGNCNNESSSSNVVHVSIVEHYTTQRTKREVRSLRRKRAIFDAFLILAVLCVVASIGTCIYAKNWYYIPIDVLCIIVVVWRGIIAHRIYSAKIELAKANKNKRVYPVELLRESMEKIDKADFMVSFVGEIEHPE